MTQALVTGGTGFIGAHVARRLLAEGIPVRCLVRRRANRAILAGLPVELFEGDLCEPETLAPALAGCDLLFHVAADYRLWARDPEDLARTNIEGTRWLLEAAGRTGVERIVFTSSVSAIGRPEGNGRLGVGREELDPPIQQQIGAYKKTKFASDLLARQFAVQGLPIVIVNPSTPIGSHDIKPTPTGKMIVDFLNRRMPAYVETGMNFVDVEDVAAGHWLACRKGKIGQRYILGNRNMTLKEFLDLLAQVSGLPAPRFRIPYAVAWVAGALSTTVANLRGREPRIPLDGVRMAHETMYYDASKAVRELGLPQTPIEQAVRKAVRWFRDQGYAPAGR